MKNKVALVGILAIVFTVLAVSSVAAIPIPPGKDAVVWFEPDPSSGAYGNNIDVYLWVNTSVYLVSWADWIYFDSSCVNITDADFTGTPFSEGAGWYHWGDYIRIAGSDSDFCEEQTGELFLATLTLQCVKPSGACTSQLYHHPDHLEMFDCDFNPVPTEWVHGNFSCEYEAPPETFSKPLEPGWNLISLPLTNATDMTVANVINTSLSGSYDALYKYDVATHSFESLSSTDTMDNGVGYFINMTAADTWSYEGTPYESIEVGLSQGLNMVGWVNESGSSLPGALNSITGNYNYVARWDATSQSYEIYEPGAPAIFNDFDTMDRGEGYFIAASEECTLDYPTP